MSSHRPPDNSIPWYLWPLIPFVFASTMLVMLPLGLLALWSIPCAMLYPDRHLHIYDVRGTPNQRKRLAQWRTTYDKMNLPQRLCRLIQKKR